MIKSKKEKKGNTFAKTLKFVVKFTQMIILDACGVKGREKVTRRSVICRCVPSNL